MNRINTLTAILIGTFCLAMPARAETSVGVSIGIYQPGVYGRIDLGNYPQPTVVYRQPVLIAPQPVVLAPQPVYLYVPSGHRRNWTRYCGQYGACGQPVYFVQERWVRERYEAQRHRGQGKGHGNNKNKRHDD